VGRIIQRPFRPLLLALALGVAAAGCPAPPPDPGALALAYAAAESGDWDAARAAAKQYLLRDPRSIAGHFLLAQTYHYQEPMQFTLAQGEYATALRLFQRDEPLGFLESRLNGDAFPARAYQQLATLHLRWAESGAAYGAPARFAILHLRQARDYVSQAMSYQPAGVATLRELDQLLEARINQLDPARSGDPTPPAPAAPPAGVHRV
jgi:hypothetical protein